MANKIIHKHSSVVTNNQPKIPTESQLEYGEIAVNYADGHETISIKNSNNGIVTFKTSEYNDEKYAPKTHEHPEYVSKEYVDGVIEDNELVIAGALNELNDSLTLKSDTDHNHSGVYSEVGHEHNASDITGGTLNIAHIPTGTTSSTVAIGNHKHVSSGITDSVSAVTSAMTAETKLVQGRAVVNYAAPKSHASSSTTYGVATTSDYGHVKISNGDVATVASANGLAAGMGHSHSNYSTTGHTHDDYSPTDHIHNASDITEGTLNIARIPTGTTSSTVAIGNHKHVSSGITDSVSYASDITSGQTKLVQGRVVYSYAAPKSHTHVSSAITDSVSTVTSAMTAETKLVQARAVVNYAAPKSHTHDADDITTGTLDIARIPTGTTSSTVAIGNHKHVSSGITDSVSAASDITSGQTKLVQGKAVYAYAAPKSHTHDEYLITPIVGSYSVSSFTDTSMIANKLAGEQGVELIVGAVLTFVNATDGAVIITNGYSITIEADQDYTYLVNTSDNVIIRPSESLSFTIREENLLSPVKATFAPSIANITATSTTGNYPLIFGTSTTAGGPLSTGNRTLYMDNVNNIHYNPSTNTLTVANIVGTASSATTATSAASATTATNATSATTATNANNVKITVASSNANYPVILGPSTTANGPVSTGNKALYTDSANNMYYNPSSNTLTVANINGLASSATTLNTSNTINGVNYTGAADVSNYAICESSGSTNNKQVSISNFKLTTGARVSVKFTNNQETSYADGISLQVGTTTAKIIYYKDEPVNGTNISFKKDIIYDFVYDGTYWRLQGEWDVFDVTTPITYGTINGITYDGRTNISNYAICDTAAETSAKILTVPNIKLTNGTVLYVKFTNGSRTSSVTFKINDGSNSRVRLRGADSTAMGGYNINNLDYYKFIFDGTYWNLMPNDAPVTVKISTTNYNSTTSGNRLHTGVYYRFTSTTSTSMNLTSIDSTVGQSFTMEITTGTSAPTITFPSTWKWVNGAYPVFEANKTYQISTFNNCAVCASFSSVKPS